MALVSSPPAYSSVAPQTRKLTTSAIADDQLWGLRGYDIVYVVDDSTLMSWTEKRSGIIPWGHARDALKMFSSVCAEWDSDGQDVWFLNQHEPLLNATPEQIEDAFNRRSPHGGTNMGRKLLQVTSEYFRSYEPGVSKPLNILAITDGQFSDDVMSVIKWIVQQLDKVNAMPNQIGIQFVQIGANLEAERCLAQLDDDLEKMNLTRDIVDTVPWIPQKMGLQFDGKYLVKVVCGAINKKLDGQKVGQKTAGLNLAKKPSRLRRIFGSK